jgi:uncharacterized protein
MRIKAWLGARPVIAFVILAYGISWSLWLPLLAARQGWVSWSASAYLHLWGSLGPAVAALIVTGVVDGRAGIAGLVRAIGALHGRLGWLGLAVLYPLTVFAAAVVSVLLPWRKGEHSASVRRRVSAAPRTLRRHRCWIQHVP